MSSTLQGYLNVRREEVAPLVASILFYFFVLSALMVLRPAREALGMQSGLDAVRWLFVGTAVVTLLVNPIFGLLVSRYRRLQFISATYLFFAASLLVFYALLVFAPAAIGEFSGRVFYVWYSVFNLFVNMVFWALMADRFTLEQSKRLFAVIAVGGTLGAIVGPWLATRIAEPFGTSSLVLVSVTFLVLAVAAAWAVAKLQPEAAPDQAGVAGQAGGAVEDRAIIGGSAWQGFHAVIRSPYLIGIAGYILVVAIMATFLYFTRLQMVAALGDDLDMRTAVFARIDMITQIATLVLQLTLAGQVMKRLGVSVALAIYPVIVALGFIGLAIVGTLMALTIVQAAFNATQRAIMRPARETLFTVVGREDKYKAKAFTDTFMYRIGDVTGAFTEGLLGRLGMGLMALVSVTVPVSLGLAVLGVWLGKVQRQEAVRAGSPVATEALTG